jgi:exosome complex RNA-binding protein Rrp4
MPDEHVDEEGLVARPVLVVVVHMDVTYSFILGVVQGVQAVVDPVVSLYVPAVQDVQVDPPAVVLYDPAAHTEHESDEPDPV